MTHWTLLLALVASLAGCTTALPGTALVSTSRQVAVLEPLGPLFTATVDVAGAPRRFLVDTGGGMTVFSPELASQAGCALGGPITGFRMSGERLDAPRCEGATVGVAGWVSRAHTVMVMDINKLLPPDWPRLDGLLSLSTFQGNTVTIDLARRRLSVNHLVPQGARSVRARFERSVTGLSLVAFMASRHNESDLWLEVDTGSTSALLINQPLAQVLGQTALAASSGITVDLRIDNGSPVRAPVEMAQLIVDGNIGLGIMRTWALTFDLRNDQVWVRRP